MIVFMVALQCRTVNRDLRWTFGLRLAPEIAAVAHLPDCRLPPRPPPSPRRRAAADRTGTTASIAAADTATVSMIHDARDVIEPSDGKRVAEDKRGGVPRSGKPTSTATSGGSCRSTASATTA